MNQNRSATNSRRPHGHTTHAIRSIYALFVLTSACSNTNQEQLTHDASLRSDGGQHVNEAGQLAIDGDAGNDTPTPRSSIEPFVPNETPRPVASLVEPDPLSNTGGDLATRLARLIWRSAPDEETRQLLAQGKLSSAEEVYAEATRLLADARAANGFRSFFGAWAEFQRPGEGSASVPPLDAGAGAAVAADAATAADGFTQASRAELSSYVMNLVRANAGIKQLFTSPWELEESGLRELFESEAEPNTANERVGILTQPFLLAAGSRSGRPSPSKRGTFIARRLLCVDIPEDLGGAGTSVPKGMSTRQWLEEVTEPDTCRACHQRIDALGLALEGFDQLGRTRTYDAEFPVDTAVDLDGLGLPAANGAAELQQSLLFSPDTLPCLLSQWFTYALERPLEGSDQASWLQLVRGAEFYTLAEVPAHIAATDAFRRLAHP